MTEWTGFAHCGEERFPYPRQGWGGRSSTDTSSPAMFQRFGFTVPALLTGAILLSSRTSLADNPIVQTNYTADPAPMVYGERLYLYTSHDEDVSVNNFFTMNDWRLYSTVDMVNWTDHGSPAGYKTFSWGTGDAWAVQGVARNGKFYLYAPINNSTGAKIGVLVADSPQGPFSDPLGKALVSTGSGDIDPTVFVDDDGQAYLYWGNPNLWYVKLNSDLISYQGSPTKVNLTTAGFGTRSNSDRATAYEEGPWFYKRGSLYYIVYPADGTPEKISFTTSSSPTGPWTYGGDVMAKETGNGSSFTNHPGVIDYKGKSYFFYHNGALPGGGGYKRSVCVEEFTYESDGSIPTIKMSTEGPAPIATLDPFQQVEAETIAFSSGLKTETCTDTGGGIDVTSISNGDYIKVRNIDFRDGATSFDARVSGAGSNAKIELHLDSQSGTVLGTCDVSGALAWATKTCAVSGGTGTHDLFLKFIGGPGDLFKFNWWKFSGPTTSNPGGGAGGMTATSGAAGLGGAATSGGTPSTSGGEAANTAGRAGAGSSNVNSGGTSNAAGGTLGRAGASSSAGTLGNDASGGDAAVARSGAAGVSSGASGATAARGGASGTSATSSTAGGGASAGSNASGGSATNAGSSNSSGCGCRVGSSPSRGMPIEVVMALGLLLRRRSTKRGATMPWRA